MAKEKEKKVPEEEALPEETAPEEEETTEETAETPAAPEKDAEKEIADLQDKLLRTLAEYDNFRRRSQKEKEALYGEIKADTIGKLLPVIDNFERAAAADADFEAYKKGVEMTVRQLLDVMKSLGVEAFGEKGEPFDPNFHNAVLHEENEELDENVVSDVFLKGYKLGDKVIRHATVKVAN